MTTASRDEAPEAAEIRAQEEVRSNGDRYELAAGEERIQAALETAASLAEASGGRGGRSLVGGVLAAGELVLSTASFILAVLVLSIYFLIGRPADREQQRQPGDAPGRLARNRPGVLVAV